MTQQDQEAPRALRTIVTGAARGIGRTIASRFIGDGHRVAMIDRDDATDIAAEIGALAVTADLADIDQARKAVDDAIDVLDGVDVVVNNAGVFHIAPILEESPEAWDATFAVNTRAMFVVMQRAAPTMIEQATGGRIINISSMGAKLAEAGQAAYAASKAAVIALTQAAAAEFGPHEITANAVCPGYVLTDLGAETRTPDMIDDWRSRSPLGRCATTDDVANLVAYLASSEADYVTGQALNVSGGMIVH